MKRWRALLVRACSCPLLAADRPSREPQALDRLEIGAAEPVLLVARRRRCAASSLRACRAPDDRAPSSPGRCARGCAARSPSRRPSSFSPKPMWRRSSFTTPSSTSRGDRIGGLRVTVEDGELERFEDDVLREDRRLPVLARDQLEQAALEEQQAAAGAPLDLGLGILDAEVAQAVQQHLEVPPLVGDLRREEDLRRAGSARWRSGRSRLRAPRSRRRSSCRAR